MGVPVSVWVFAIIITVVVLWITLWVTRKAYSKKWEDHVQEGQGNEQHESDYSAGHHSEGDKHE